MITSNESKLKKTVTSKLKNSEDIKHYWYKIFDVNMNSQAH